MVNQVPFRQASSLDLDKTTSGIRDTVDGVFDVKTNLLSALGNVTDNVVIGRLLKTATNITDYATHALTPYVNPYIANTSTRLVDTFRHGAFFWDKESRGLAWENIKALSLSIVDPFRDPVRGVWYGLVKNETVDRRANGGYHGTLLEKNIENPYKAINGETDLVKATEQARILKMEDYRKKLADLEGGEAAAA